MKNQARACLAPSRCGFQSPYIFLPFLDQHRSQSVALRILKQETPATTNIYIGALERKETNLSSPHPSPHPPSSRRILTHHHFARYGTGLKTKASCKPHNAEPNESHLGLHPFCECRLLIWHVLTQHSSTTPHLPPTPRLLTLCLAPSTVARAAVASTCLSALCVACSIE